MKNWSKNSLLYPTALSDKTVPLWTLTIWSGLIFPSQCTYITWSMLPFRIASDISLPISSFSSMITGAYFITNCSSGYSSGLGASHASQTVFVSLLNKVHTLHCHSPTVLLNMSNAFSKLLFVYIKVSLHAYSSNPILTNFSNNP